MAVYTMYASIDLYLYLDGTSSGWGYHSRSIAEGPTDVRNAGWGCHSGGSITRRFSWTERRAVASMHDKSFG